MAENINYEIRGIQRGKFKSQEKKWKLVDNLLAIIQEKSASYKSLVTFLENNYFNEERIAFKDLTEEEKKWALIDGAMKMLEEQRSKHKELLALIQENRPKKEWIKLEEYKFWEYKQQLEEAIIQTSEAPNYDYRNFLEKEGFKDLIYNHLGICGGAFIIADKSKNNLFYLHNKDIQGKHAEELQDIPFIEIPYRYHEFHPRVADDQQKYLKLLDALYIQERNQQPLIDKDGDSPEFYRNLPHLTPQKDHLLPFEEYLTNGKIKLIYCTVGEILFNLYAWRYLVKLVQQDGIRESKIDIHKPDEGTYVFNFSYFDQIKNKKGVPGKKWLEQLMHHNFDEDIRNRWKNLHKGIDEIHNTEEGHQFVKGEYKFFIEEYKLLGLIRVKGDKILFKREFLAFIQYAIFITKKLEDWGATSSNLNAKRKKEDEQSEQLIDVYFDVDETLTFLFKIENDLEHHFFEECLFDENGARKKSPDSQFYRKLTNFQELEEIYHRIQHVIKTYLLVYIGERKLVAKDVEFLLKRLNQKTRFPILPYFYNSATGEHQHPREHLVFCIWTSPAHSVQIKLPDSVEQDETGVIFVQLSIFPIWSLAPDLEFIRDNRKIYEYKELSSEAYNRIFRIFSFFNSLSKPILDKFFYGRLIKSEIRHSAKKTDLNAFSHELNRIISNFFNLNVTFKNFFGQNLEEIKTAISRNLPMINDQSLEPIEDWKIIPNPKRLDILLTILMIWSGRDSHLILDIEGEGLLTHILKECDKLGKRIRAGEQMPIEHENKLEVVINYNKKYQSELKRLDQKGQCYYCYEEQLKDYMLYPKKPHFGNKKNKQISLDQNALLRILVASFKNIYQHTTGNFWIRIEKGDDNNIIFTFINPCSLNEESTNSKKLGTESVLRSCLDFIDGTLVNFNLIDKYKKQKFEHILQKRSCIIDHSLDQLSHEQILKEFQSYRIEELWITEFYFNPTEILTILPQVVNRVP